MKIAILVIGVIGAVLLILGKRVERRSPEARANLEGLPFDVLSFLLLGVDALLVLGFILWKVFAT